MAYQIWTNRDKTRMPATVVKETAQYIVLSYVHQNTRVKREVKFNKNKKVEVGMPYMGQKYYEEIP